MGLGVWIDRVERDGSTWAARYGVRLARVALGVIFFWFGFLKFFPGMSAAESLAGRTIERMSHGHVGPAVSMPVLATWECAIGLGLMSGRFTRLTLALLFLQMPGTFMPLVYFPGETFQRWPWVPTLLGQYIVKNLALIACGIVVGATMRGGMIVSDPRVARSARWLDAVFVRYRRRFGREPGVIPLAESLKRSKAAAEVGVAVVADRGAGPV